MIVQEGVAIEVAEAVVGALKGELSATAVNAPMVPAEVHAFSIYQLSPSIIYILGWDGGVRRLGAVLQLNHVGCISFI